jgi:hypothetical protein
MPSEYLPQNTRFRFPQNIPLFILLFHVMELGSEEGT